MPANACAPMESGGGTADVQPVADQGSERAGGRKWRLDPAQTAEPKLRFFERDGQRFAVRRDANSLEEDAVVQRIEAVAASLDLSEPFDRIRAAIEEARRGGQ